jgi:hypothetical protein
VAEKLDHESVFLMADRTALDGFLLKAGHVFFEKGKRAIKGVLMTGYAAWIVSLVLFGVAILVTPAMNAAGKVLTYLLVGEGKS